MYGENEGGEGGDDDDDGRWEEGDFGFGTRRAVHALLGFHWAHFSAVSFAHFTRFPATFLPTILYLFSTILAAIHSMK